MDLTPTTGTTTVGCKGIHHDYRQHQHKHFHVGLGITVDHDEFSVDDRDDDLEAMVNDIVGDDDDDDDDLDDDDLDDDELYDVDNSTLTMSTDSTNGMAYSYNNGQHTQVVLQQPYHYQYQTNFGGYAVAIVSDTSSMSSEDTRTSFPPPPFVQTRCFAAPPLQKKKKKRRRRKRRSRKRSKNKNGEPNNNRPDVEDVPDEEKARYVAMDCEMVGVGWCGQRSSLARVVMVNWAGETLLDLYVQQTLPVTDYREDVSGITPNDLCSDDTVSFSECRARVLAILDGMILVGHGLKADLRALGITHPWYDTRDTGKYEPFMKVRFDDGILWPRKLKELAKEKLGRDVQQEGVAHCPWEDATTAMALYKLVRRKWEKAMTYKYNKTMEIEGNQTTKVDEQQDQLPMDNEQQ